MSVNRDRRRFDGSNARLRRARRHYALLLRRWVEQARDPAVFRDRAYRCARQGIEHGLWKSAHVRSAVFGVLGQWKRYDRMNWWAWRSADHRRQVALMWEREFHNWQHDRKKKKA